MSRGVYMEIFDGKNYKFISKENLQEHFMKKNLFMVILFLILNINIVHASCSLEDQVKINNAAGAVNAVASRLDYSYEDHDDDLNEDITTNGYTGIVYVYNLKFCTELQILDRPFAWLLVVCLALFPTIISIETINIAIKFIGSTKTAILGALEPLTAIFFGVLFFHEQLTFRIICGVLLILFGVLLIITRKTQRG